MAGQSFTKKILEVRVTLAAGSFAGGGNTKTVSGVPTKVRIEKTGPPDFCKAKVEIRGLKYEDMEQLSTLAFKPLFVARNLITVMAGDSNDMSQAFSGVITSAAADFNASPDVRMNFECSSGYFGAITPLQPSVIEGQQAVSAFISSMASKAGYAFENDGVTAPLNNAVFNGSPVAQARAAARQVGAELVIDDETMVLMPSGGAGGGAGGGRGNAVLLSKSTGLLGYPQITNEGVQLKALFNPAFRLGGLVQVESIVPKASGTWRIIKLTHDLAAFDPAGGPWESQITGFIPGMSGPGGRI